MDDAGVTPSPSLTDADYLDYTDLLNERNARREFVSVLKSQVASLDRHSGNALTFAYAVVGGPWQFAWQGPPDLVDRESQTWAALHDSMDEARLQLKVFAPVGFHMDAGAGFQSAHWDVRQDEVRLYEREAVVIGMKTVKEAAFSPFWFAEIIEGTLRVAAMAFARLHPDLHIVGTCWRLVNKRDTRLRLTDRFEGANEFLPAEGAEDLMRVSQIERVQHLFGSTATFAKSERDKFSATVRGQYSEPARDD